MITTLQIISISCFAVLASETSGFVQWIKFKRNLNRMKPLDCPLCLAWWVGIIFFVLQKQFLEAPFFAATASMLAVFISRELRKL
jgi:hypothetical protein